ncbi:MAG TPA: potassium transporter TrkG [Acidobacteriota bacterium]|nr:potassium transporter TrkG [Acidobacteriota bacterium]
MKALLANIGFIMQMTGLFLIAPIALALYQKLSADSVALLLCAVCFFMIGFILNALCERKDLDFQESNILIVVSFIALGLIGALPYYNTVFGGQPFFERVTNSILESVSGFTTTGFSVISDLSVLSPPMILYRALTQFIGGVGIVLLLLMLFYPEEKLQTLAKSLGFFTNERIKQTFTVILVVYLLSGFLIGAGAYFMGFKDVVPLVSYIFAAMSSGGFSPANDISVLDTNVFGNWIIAAMILGGLNFFVITNAARLRFGRVWNSEAPFYFVFLSAGAFVVHSLSTLNWHQSLFHAVSAVTTTGFATVSLAAQSDGFKSFLVFLMFVGGCSFSTAGGIRILRLFVIAKSIPYITARQITGDKKPLYVIDKEYNSFDIVVVMASVLLFAGIIIAGTVVVSSQGYGVIDSLFEVVSALSCTGLSVGIVGAGTSLFLKWVFILLMLVGRIEIFTVLLAIFFWQE